jgi:hypothetical protein
VRRGVQVCAPVAQVEMENPQGASQYPLRSGCAVSRRRENSIIVRWVACRPAIQNAGEKNMRENTVGWQRYPGVRDDMTSWGIRI